MVIRGATFNVTLGKATGELLSWWVDGQPRLHRPLKPSLWRPPTDNDYGISMPRSKMAWQQLDGALMAVSGAQLTVAPATAPTPYIRWCATLTPDAGRVVEFRMCYVVLPGGAVLVDCTLRPLAGTAPTLPRFGVQLALADGFRRVGWLGRGPHESYWDRKEGARLGWFDGSILNQTVPYVRPQENGNKEEVRARAHAQPPLLRCLRPPFPKAPLLCRRSRRPQVSLAYLTSAAASAASAASAAAPSAAASPRCEGCGVLVVGSRPFGFEAHHFADEDFGSQNTFVRSTHTSDLQPSPCARPRPLRTPPPTPTAHDASQRPHSPRLVASAAQPPRLLACTGTRGCTSITGSRAWAASTHGDGTRRRSRGTRCVLRGCAYASRSRPWRRVSMERGPSPSRAQRRCKVSSRTAAPCSSLDEWMGLEAQKRPRVRRRSHGAGRLDIRAGMVYASPSIGRWHDEGRVDGFPYYISPHVHTCMWYELLAVLGYW